VDPELLAKYARAWERGDVEGIAAMLRHDVVTTMPPIPMWLAGREALRAFIAPRIGTPGVQRVVLVGGADPTLAFYRRPEGSTGPYPAHAIQVVRLQDGEVAEIHAFVDPSLFPRFGLPMQIDR
jgi:RNA polymerase sigma-70 factor (ECF subfamily)